LAKRYHSEVTGLVDVHNPEATRSVDMSEHDLSACSRSSFQICQIMSSVFAGGSWHAAPPELRDLESEAEMYHFRCEGPVCRFCGSDAREEAWDIATIVDHDIELRLRCPCCYNSDCGGLACPCAARDLELQHHQDDQPEQERRSEQIEGQQRVWREPRQPSSLPPRIASSSTSQLPLQIIKVEPVVEGASNECPLQSNASLKILIAENWRSDMTIYEY
jgi:hypothetical protein